MPVNVVLPPLQKLALPVNVTTGSTFVVTVTSFDNPVSGPNEHVVCKI